MNIVLKNKIIEQIPDVVAQIGEWNNPNIGQQYKLVINRYYNGKLSSIDSFVIDEDDLLNHMHDAKKAPYTTIDIADTLITVTRKCEGKPISIVATYTPIAKEE